MPSSPKIPRELIIKTALDMVIRDGYEAITIKAIAKELQCSTQPISWQFGNMEEFRRALADAAFRYASDYSAPAGRTCAKAFEAVGRAYLDLAFDAPNLVRFIAAQSKERVYEGRLLSVMDQQRNRDMAEKLAMELWIQREAAQTFMQTLMVYTHGLAMLIAFGLLREDRETAYAMIHETGIRELVSLGIGPNRAREILEGSG